MKVWRHPLWLPLHRSTPAKSLEASAEAGGVPSYGAKPSTCTMYIDAVSASCWLSYKGKRCDTDIGLGGQPGNGQGTSKLCSSRRENLVSLSQGFVSFYQFFVLLDNICQIWCCLFFSSNSLLHKGWLWQQKSWRAKRRCWSREDCRIYSSTSQVS